MTDISLGQVVEFLENGRFILGACIEKKNGRFHLITNSGKEINLSVSRFIHISPIKLPTQPKSNLIRELQKIHLNRDLLKKDIDLKELWEILKDEKGVFQPKEIAELLYPEEFTPDHEAALIRAVLDEQLYFKFKDNLIFVQDEETISKIFEKREQEQRELRKFEKALCWIKEIFSGNVHNKQLFAEDRELIEFIDELKDFCINGEEARSSKQIKNFLKNPHLPHGITPFDILIKSGVWDEDINIDCLRVGLSNHIPQNIQKEVDDILIGNKFYEISRKDLRFFPIFTVDGPDTLDHDDAISFIKRDGYWELGIHITDFSNRIDENSNLFRWAINRATSIYMPDETITMLPPILCHDTWSLTAGKDKEALSFIVKIRDNGEIIHSEIFQSIINVKKRYNYNEFDDLILKNSEIETLYNFCLNFQEQRIKKGALPLPIPELNIKVINGKPNISLAPITPARFLIAECMVLANNVGAAFLRDNSIPAIYRSQPEPRERLIRGVSNDVKLNYQQRRLLSRGIMDVEPAYHSGLGLNAYTTLTSPLRRGLDLIMQKQISYYFHSGKPLFSKEELQKYLTILQEGLTTATQITHSRNRYWILKYFSEMINVTLNAWFLENAQNKVIAVLEDYLITVELPKVGENKFIFGDPIKVVIKKSIPRENILKVDWA